MEEAAYDLLGRLAERAVRMRGTGVDHFDLVVSDLDPSLEFYRGLLEPLGYSEQAT